MAGELLFFLLSVGLAQTPGPIISIDTSVTIAPGGGDHRAVKAAAGAGVVFTVFSDTRDTTSAIFAARTDFAGTRLDAQSLRVSAVGAPSATDPDVAFDGTNFLVVWSEGPATTPQIRGRRFAPSGAAVDATPLDIGASSSPQRFPSLSFDGSRYFVTWRGPAGAAHVRGTFVSTAGVPVDPAGLVLSDIASTSDPLDAAAVAFDGTRHVVIYAAFAGTWNVYARAITTGGVLNSPSATLATSSSDERKTFVCERSGEVLAGWTLFGSTQDTNVVRINAAGVVDTTPFRIGRGPGDQTDGTCEFDPATGNWIVLFEEQSVLNAARLSAAGTLLDTSGISLSSTPRQVFSLGSALTTSGPFLIWNEQNLSLPQIDGCYTSRVLNPPALANDPGILLSLAADTHQAGALLSVTSGQVAAYTQLISQSLMKSATLDATGPVARYQLDDGGARVVRAGASNGQNGAVVFTQNTANAGVLFFGPSGAPVTSPFATAFPNTVNTASVASLGDGGYLGAFGAGTSLYAVRFTQSGGVVTEGTHTQLSPGVLVRQTPAGIGCGDTACLVTWSNVIVGGGGGLPIGASFLSPVTGAVMTPAPKVPPNGEVPSTAVASDGHDFLLAWEQRTDAGNNDILFGRIDSNGVLLDTAARPACTAPGNQSDPAVIFDGQEWWVLWIDARSSQGDVYALRVATDGGVQSPADGVPIWQEATAIRAIRAAAVQPGEILTMVERTDPLTNVHRVFVRAVTAANPVLDGGAADAGSPDGGLLADGGSADGGGSPDGGTVDNDAGPELPDGSILLTDGAVLLPDGAVLLEDGGFGQPFAPRVQLRVGCGCNAVDGALGALVLLFALLRRSRTARER